MSQILRSRTSVNSGPDLTLLSACVDFKSPEKGVSIYRRVSRKNLPVITCSLGEAGLGIKLILDRRGHSVQGVFFVLP